MVRAYCGADLCALMLTAEARDHVPGNFAAQKEGCSAVVLGHHRDDILEDFFMNLFHGGKLARCLRSF